MEGKKYEDIEERTFKFSVRVIKMVLQLPNNNVATKNSIKESVS